MKINSFIFLLDGSEYKKLYLSMLEDLNDRDDVKLVIDKRNPSLIKQLLLKRKTIKLFNGSLDFLSYEKNMLYKEIKSSYKSDEFTVVVFFNAALHFNPYLPGTLKKYKTQWPNLRFVLLYTDIMNVPVSKNADYLRSKNVFDLVYTIEGKDAKATGSILWHTIYSKDNKEYCIQPEYDLYFCGVSKNRETVLSATFKQALLNNVNLRADIVCEKDTNRDLLSDIDNGVILHDHFFTYDYVLKNELLSSCILEVVQPGQQALTLRPYECVVYGRKLLTNSPEIMKFDYYDSKFMKYFNSANDIDWEWVKDKKKVDYHYDGRYSPYSLIEDISKRISFNEFEKEM